MNRILKRLVNEHYTDPRILNYSRNWTLNSNISQGIYCLSQNGNSRISLESYRVESEGWLTNETHSRSWRFSSCRSIVRLKNEETNFHWML